MIDVSLQARRAVAEDHQEIASLMLHEANVHRHLDWRSPIDWLGSPEYWVLEQAGRVSAALACPAPRRNSVKKLLLLLIVVALGAAIAKKVRTA